MAEVILNTEQDKASKKIIKFYNNYYDTNIKKPKQIFALAGYAGTGKTFLISHIIKNMLHLDMKDVSFVTPTGKAASLLIQKGLTNTTTLHKKIYIPYTKKVIKEDSSEVETLRFAKKDNISKPKLMVVDEGSMISLIQIKDLLSYELPILIVGDPFQLPPVGSEEHTLFSKPDHTLSQIVRQSEGNPIIEIATGIREGKDVYIGNYGGKVLVVDYASLTGDAFKEAVMKADQVLCGYNRTKDSINTYIRRNLGRKSSYPENDDKVICTRNNYEITLDDEKLYSLVNGLMGNIVNVKLNREQHLATFNFKADFLDNISTELVGSTRRFVFGTAEKEYEEEGKVYTLSNGEIVKAINQSEIDSLDLNDPEQLLLYNKLFDTEMENKRLSKKERKISYFDYGYCISVHKSQGSEWKKVVLLDERGVMNTKINQARWLYTAVTRTKDKIIIIKNFKNNIR